MSETQIVEKEDYREITQEDYREITQEESKALKVKMAVEFVNKILDRAAEIKSKLIIDVPLTLPIIKIKTKVFQKQGAYAATDGRNLYIEPSWFKLPNDQAEGVLYHEWCHICLFHPKRMKNRIHKIWNYACDFFIDYHIMHEFSNCKISIAPGMLYDSYYNYEWSAEKIYEDLLNEVNKLKEEAKKNKNLDNMMGKKGEEGEGEGEKKEGSGSGFKKGDFCNRETAIKNLAFEGFISDLMADDLILPQTEDFNEKELIREIIKAAEMHKKSKGNLPGFYKKQIEKLRRARVPWDQVFQNIFMEIVMGSDDRTFAKPKRWAMPFDLYLPSETGFEKQEVVLILDTSGSMYCNKVFERFVGEVKKILPYVKKLTVISSDATVHEKVDIKTIYDLIGTNSKFKFKGGGGTDFRPALQAASKIRSDFVIYYTDGFGTYGDKPKSINRLLWVLTEEESTKPPFGKYLIVSD